MTKVDGGRSPYSRYLHELEREIRTPRRLPPPGAWDTQIHVYGDPQRYPYHPGRFYDPPDDTGMANARAMHRILGFDRGVIVHTSVNGTDNRLLLDCLAEDPEHYRGVALIDDSVTDAELRRLHAAGVRGARFQFKRNWGDGVAGQGKIHPHDDFLRSVERIGKLGWAVKLRTSGPELIEHEALFRSLTGVNVVIDHLGHLDMRLGVGQPAAQLILDLLKQPNWWIQLSNGPKHADAPYDDAVAIACAFIAVAPDRAIWASDWPHVGYHKPVPNTTELFELLERYAPDPAQYHRILIENPQRLYGSDAAASR
jgi:2-pyrone-4,6-dicarboxylate lactonase